MPNGDFEDAGGYDMDHVLRKEIKLLREVIKKTKEEYDARLKSLEKHVLTLLSNKIDAP